jgi:hypothetical protein
MNASGTHSKTAFAAWLEQQREVLQRLATEQDPAQLRAELEKWWQQAATHAPAEAHELAARLFDLGQGYLQGLQQFARAAASTQGADDGASAGGNAMPGFGLDLLAAWRNARWGGDSAGLGATSALLAPWLEAMARMPAVGAARPYVSDARELAHLHAQCLQLEEQLMVLLQGVQHEALTQLQARIATRRESGMPVQSFRELYEIWIECGERAYAEVAHGPQFIKLQTDFANRALRMRVVQRRIAERIARALDLPTRSEVNALHLQVRELKRRLNRERDATVSEPVGKRTRRPKTAKAKSS